MQRYFLTKLDIENDVVTVTGDDARHIGRVLRMKEDDVIQCIIEERTATCKLTDITNEFVKARIVEWKEESNELPVHVTIASGLPKGDKLEYIIQKGTELGASVFLPFVASRSIVKWDEKKGAKKVERWEKIAKEAAEQSYRNVIPTVCSPATFKQLLQQSKEYDACIVAYEEDAKIGESSALKEVFERLQMGQKVLVVFGPEGGITDQEVEQLVAHGFTRCSLGPRILRTETAPLYALSAMSYYFELSR